MAEDEALKWQKIWHSHGELSSGEHDRPWEGQVFDEPLVHLEAKEFKAICKKFSKHTGLGADAWHPRWWAWLTEEGWRPS